MKKLHFSLPARRFKSPDRWLTAVAAIVTLAIAGCSSGSSSSATPTPTVSATATPTAVPTASPTPSPTPTPVPPPPFNNAKNEGALIGGSVVTTYPTLTSGGTTGLDSFYTSEICSGLAPTDCANNENNLNTAQFGNFDLATNPIGNNPLGIAAVDAVKIEYTAINVDQSALPVSGGILVPKISPSSLKGIILYFHGTTVDRNNVPSNFTPLSNIGSYTDGVVLAAIWASQGYVVVMPDYIGLGDDTAHVHPYVVYPRTDAQSGLAMVKAARAYLAANYNIGGNVPFYISGYSEGGAYALMAEHMMQDNPLYGGVLDVSLRKAAPLSGFFDLSGTGLPYLFDNISASNNNWYSLNPTVSALSKPYLSAYLLLSFASYSGITPTNILASGFYNCPAGATQCGAGNNLDGVYFTAAQGPGYNNTVALLAFALAQNTAWGLDNNAVTPLLTPAYATALQNQDTSNPLYQQVAASDTYLFTPTVPVTLVSLMEDSVVTRKNTDVAYAYFTGQNPKGPYKEQLVTNSNFVVPSGLGVDYLNAPGSSGTQPVDHLTELPFLSVLILNEFNEVP